ncbi:MAG: methionyl-tRNA formyltransferase [Cyclobacteriaceae bacterium]
MKGLRIVFMGTPEFAVASLHALTKSQHQVVAVVTAPDKPQGRGLLLTPSPVKTAALNLQIPILQPEKLKDENFLDQLRGYRADVFVVVAFRMLPEVVWSMPEFGTINLHASLLPKYRGAAPINWAIMNGETETGVTTFRLKQEIDTGNILFSEPEPIYPDDDAGSLYERLMQKGSKLVVKTVDAIAEGTAQEIPQANTSNPLPVAPKLFKETCELQFTSESKKCLNAIRGLSPYPAAWCKIHGRIFKIYKASASMRQQIAEPGTIETDQKTKLEIRCQDGWIQLSELQPEGKKRMTVEEFFRGNKI